MRFGNLQKLMIGFTSLVMLVLVALPAQAQEVIWERNSRTEAQAPVPEWLTGANERGLAYGVVNGQPSLLVASRTGSLNIRVLDALTGEDVSNTIFDLSSVSGGLFPINDVSFTEDGKVVVTNLTTDASAAANPFKVYVFEPTGGAPIASFGYNSAGVARFGDKASVTGSWSGGTFRVLAAQQSSNPGVILSITTTDQGANWASDLVTVTAEAAGNRAFVGNSSVAVTANGDFLVNGNGSLVKRYSPTGEYRVGQNIGTTGSMTGVRAFTVDDKEYAVIYAYRETAAGTDPSLGYVKAYDITNPEAPELLFRSPKMASAASGNAINGDVDFRLNDDGTFIVYGLAATQGLMAFGTAPAAPTPVFAAWDFQGQVGIFAGAAPAKELADNLVSAEISRGAGLREVSLNNAYSSNNFIGATYEDAVANDKYLQIEIVLEPGYKAALSEIEYVFRRTNTGPSTAQWAYSLDGGSTFALLGNPIDLTVNAANDAVYGPFDLEGVSALQNVESYTPLILRKYAWGASGDAGTGAFGRSATQDDVVIKGIVSVDPDYVPPAPVDTADLIAELSGLVEVPANLSPATGTVTAVLTDDVLVVTGSFSDLEGTYTMSHIHTGVAGTNGGVIFTLDAEIASDGSGSYSAADNTFTLTPDQVAALLAGEYYINIHSTEFPAGEIRGQLLADPNTAPTASAITAPADEAELTVAGFASTPFVPGWSAATDADGDRVVYVWQLAADADFDTVLLTISANTATTADLTFGAVDALLAENDVEVGQTITLHHRVVSTDGSALTVGDAASVVLTRGVVFDTFAIADVYDVADGTVVTIEGLVTRAVGNETRLQDNTAGISTFGPTGSVISSLVATGDLAKGDSVRITGQKSDFNDLIQLSQITEVVVLSRENPLPAPQLVTLAEIRDNGADYLSQLIRVEGITISGSGNFVANTSYNITDATVTQEGVVEFRVPSAVNTTLPGTAIPDRAFNYEGVLAIRQGLFRLYPQEATDIELPALPLAGVYFIPQGANDQGFATLGEAVAALNEVGASDEVVFVIDGDLVETSPVRINRPDLTEDTPVAITPAPGKNVTISLPLLSLVDTGHVLINGSNDGEGERNMTIIKNGGGGGLLGVFSDSKDVIIANLTLTYEDALGAGTYAMIVNRHEVSGNTGRSEDLTIFNVGFGTPDKPWNDGIWLFGDANATPRAVHLNTSILENDFHVGRSGMRTQTHVSTVVDGNRFFGYGFDAEVSLMRLNTPLSSFEFTNNELVFVTTARTAATTFIGFQATNSLIEEVYVVNNTFSTGGFSGTEGAHNFYGFRHEGAASVADFITLHNTFRITDTGSTGIHAAVVRTAGSSNGSTMNFVNNIVSLERSAENTYAYVWQGTSLDANSNHFFNGGSGAIALVGETRYATLNDFVTGTGNDNISTTGSVEFVSLTNLRLTGSSIGDRNFAGVPIDLVPFDIDGNERSDTEPYKGAFEGDAFGTDLNIEDMPIAFVLNQNYPNPFNPTTTISYQLPVETQVQLNVYTVTGQLVATLVNDVRPAGVHQVNFDATRLASGVYVYRIIAGDFIQTQKMTLIK